MGITDSVTRRHMLQLTGAGVLGAAALASVGCDSASKEVAEEKKTDTAATAAPVKQTYTVYDPTGSVEITQTYAPRLDTVDGKTIAFASDGMWADDRTFELITQLFAEKHPTTTIIREDNFPIGIDALTKADNPIVGMMQDLHVDAAIIGNAG